MKAILCCLTMLCVLAVFGRAQSPSDNTVQAPTSKIMLREGTEVHLKLGQDVNSRTAKQDAPVELLVDEALKVDNVVLVDAGSRAIGFVVHSAKPDFWGNPGELSIRLTFLKVGKTKVPLRGAKGEVGSFRGIIRGSQAVIKQGTPVKAYIDQDTEVEAPRPASPSEGSGSQS